MQKRLSLGLSLGFAGNIFFLLFAIVCYVYYSLYDPESGLTKALEITAYGCMFTGFGLLTFSDIIICVVTRMRKPLKIAFSLYIIMEAFMMYCELNSFEVKSFYEPYSVMLAVVHSILSAVVCFTFLSLDPYKTPFEVLVIICIGVILGGMFGSIMGIRVYFSIFVNSMAFMVLFGVIKSMYNRRVIEIDCHGDAARVAEYNGFFSDDGKPEKKAPARSTASAQTKAVPEDKSESASESAAETASPEDKKESAPDIKTETITAEEKSESAPEEKTAQSDNKKAPAKSQGKPNQQGKPSGGKNNSGKNNGKKNNGGNKKPTGKK